MPLAGYAAVEAVDPAAVGHGLFQGYGVAFLADLVRGEGLDLVGHDGLFVSSTFDGAFVSIR